MSTAADAAASSPADQPPSGQAPSDLPLFDPALLDRADLTDPRLHAQYDLSAVWRRLRDEDPVYLHPESRGGSGFWVVTRYEDVAAVYGAPDVFTSERGNVLDTLLAGGDPACGQMMAVTDGQHHAKLRTLLNKRFSPRALGVVVESVRRGTRRLVQDAVQAGTCDFAADVAAHIPLAAICDLLGVPEADRGLIFSLSSSALASALGAPTQEGTWTAKNDILCYFSELASSRRAKPYDDVVSLLTGAGELSQSEVILNCYSIVLGGNETTRYSMTGGLLALMRNPSQWDALCSGEAAVDRAVDEVLRWTTPTLHAGRTATRDLSFGGRLIEAGDVVTVWNASANRDERQFDRPDSFDLSRRPNKHLTFAFGPHFCIGSYLARAEIAALLEALRETVRRVESAGPANRVYSNFLSGLSTLPVTLTARPGAHRSAA